MLAARECGGRLARALHQLPQGVQRRLNCEYDKLPSLVLSLAEVHQHGDIALLREKIKRVSDVLGVSMVGNWSAQRCHMLGPKRPKAVLPDTASDLDSLLDCQ